MNIALDSMLHTNAMSDLKDDLQQRREELTQALQKLRRDVRILGDASTGDVADDCCDNSSAEAILSVYSHSRLQLYKVEAALGRIASGEFGFCVTCGNEIGLKRLRALPWASHCIACQQRSEVRREY